MFSLLSGTGPGCSSCADYDGSVSPAAPRLRSPGRVVFRIFALFALYALFTVQAAAALDVSRWVALTSLKPCPSSLERTPSSTPGALGFILHTGGFYDRVEKIGGVPYRVIEIPRACYTERPDFPRLPVILKTIVVPWRARVSVRVHPGESMLFKDYLLKPVPGGSRGRRRVYSVYHSKDWYFPKLVKVVDEVVIRSVRLVTLAHFPVQVRPRSSTLRVFTDIAYDLVLRDAADEKIRRMAARRYSPVFTPVIQRIADIGKPPEYTPPGPACAVDGCDYLIIADRSFSGPARKLAVHKRSKGLITDIVYLDEIATVPTADRIKDFLAEYYFNRYPAPTYVLLMGELVHIPTFEKKDSRPAGDVRYTFLDGADFLPDLFVGRIPSVHVRELGPVVDKIISFENSVNSRRLHDAAYIISPAGLDRGATAFCGDAAALYPDGAVKWPYALFAMGACTVVNDRSQLWNEDYFRRLRGAGNLLMMAGKGAATVVAAPGMPSPGFADRVCARLVETLQPRLMPRARSDVIPEGFYNVAPAIAALEASFRHFPVDGVKRRRVLHYVIVGDPELQIRPFLSPAGCSTRTLYKDWLKVKVDSR